MNEFRFNNVGQGLFYSGSLNNGAFNFVYDCGSESLNSNIYLQNSIEKLSFDKLDFLVVSHLHKDHTNGIPFLLWYHRNPKLTILLPYFPIDFQYDPQNLFVRSFLIVQGYNFESLGAIIKQIHDSNKLWKLIDESKHDFQYHSYQHQFDCPWSFHLINKCVSTNKIQHVVNEIVSLLNGEGLEKYLTKKENIKQIANIYIKHFRNLNLTSTILVHYPLGKVNESSVLTGDAEFDSFIEKNINLKNIKYFQIPHHGSFKNWASISDSFKNKIQHFYVSFGLGNIYHHPSQKIVNDLINKYQKKVDLAYQSIDPFFFNCCYSI